jgi:hypothetical protein
MGINSVDSDGGADKKFCMSGIAEKTEVLTDGRITTRIVWAK